MCGICGKISYNENPVDESSIKKMCRMLGHRGPDDEGIYLKTFTGNKSRRIGLGFGHSRLSIIDLSRSAQQPMSNEDKSIWLTYNGEIYNFKDLRAELERHGHIFKSNSDTEVIIHLYEEKGIQAVHEFNGMFAFALWDNKFERLWLCRDRLGIKPIVYFWDGQHFVFASEIKALLANPDIPKALDYDALQLYLAFNYIPAPYTIFKGIRKLEPGHYLILENGKISVNKYWDVPEEVDPEVARLPFKEQLDICKRSLYEVLSGAVNRRLIADVPLGAFLSGGIDSSVVVAIMAQYSEGKVQTFSIGYQGDQLYDETVYAREVAQLYNTKHHEFKLSHEDILKAIPGVLSSFDEPFADSSAIPTYIVSRETRKHVGVALSGDGGDELFAGYRSYLAEYWHAKYKLIPGLLRKSLIESIISALPDSRDKKVMEYVRRLKKFIRSSRGSFPERMLALKEIFPFNIRQELLPGKNGIGKLSPNDPALLWVGKLLNGCRGDRLNNILYSDLKDSLPGDMLTKVDLMSMRNSLEVRVPFLDHRVVELAFKMKGALKLHKGKTKFVLKETFKDILPAGICRRPKAGFEVPISRWMKNELRFLLEHYLSEARIRRQGIFDYKIIERLVAKHLNSKTDTSWMLWNLIVFQSWHEQYF